MDGASDGRNDRQDKQLSQFVADVLEREYRDVTKVLMWLGVACVFGIGVQLVFGKELALQYIAGYVIELTLSVDNLFVFLLIFNFFKVPRDSQEPVLLYGILGAMILRGCMILAGSALIQRWAGLYFLFAVFLLYSAVKLFFEGNDDNDSDVENTFVVWAVRKVLPVSDRYSGRQFFIRDSTGRWLATPLFLVLCCVELSDVVFAMDSVPAVLGISTDRFVIYSSNMMAILGLRALFFVIADAIGAIKYLKQSLSLVLAFVAIKMIGTAFQREIDIVVSLFIILGILCSGCLLSFTTSQRDHLPSHSSGCVRV